MILQTISTGDYMRLIKQPPGSSLCGQCCVAMIAGVTVEEAIKRCRTQGATGSTTLRRALWYYRILLQHPVRMPRAQVPDLPDTAILRLCSKRDGYKLPNTHWAVWHKGEILDPSFGRKQLDEHGWKIVTDHCNDTPGLSHSWFTSYWPVVYPPSKG